MARIDASGAEKGSTSELDSTTVTPVIGAFASDTTQARAGARSWRGRLIGATSLADQAYGTMLTPGTDPTAYAVFFAFYLDPSLGVDLGGTSKINFLRLHHVAAAEATAFTFEAQWTNNAATATIIVRAGTFAAPLATLTFAGVATGRWHLAQIRVTIGTAPLATDSWSVRIDGAEQTGAAVDLTTGGLLQVDLGVLGQNDLVNLATDVNVFIDDIIVDNANSGTQTIPEASFLAYVEPTADLEAGWTNTGGAAAHAAALTDESNATLIETTTDAVVDRLAHSDVSDTVPAAFTTVPAVYTSWIDSTVDGTDLPGDVIVRHQLAGSDGTNTTVTATTGTIPTTRRSVHVRTTAPDGAAWTIAKVNDLRLRLEADIGLNEHVGIYESWTYAEVQVRVNVDDPSALADAVASLTVDTTIADTAALAEAVALAVDLAVSDGAALAETLALEAALALDDTAALAESPLRIIYVPQEGGAAVTARGADMLLAERAAAAVPLAFTVSQSGTGGVTGLSPTIAIREAESSTSYLDWDDDTFKAAGWGTKYASMTEVERGHYRRAFDPSAVASLAVGDVLAVEYHVDNGGDVRADDSLLLLLVASLNDLATAHGIADIQNRLPTTLSSGRMRAQVEGLDADTITAAAIAAGAITSSEAPALANLDAAVSTRATPADVTAARDAVLTELDATEAALLGAIAVVASAVDSARVAILAAVATRLASADYTAPDNAGVLLLRRIAMNRLEQLPGSPGTLVLYADDAVTPLHTWTLRDHAGGAVTPVTGAPALRGAAT